MAIGGFLIIRRSGTACEARTGSVSPLGDLQARLQGGERANFREAKFPCHKYSTYSGKGSPKNPDSHLWLSGFFDYPFRYENPASCQRGSRFCSLGAACPERSEDFDLPYGSPENPDSHSWLSGFSDYSSERHGVQSTHGFGFAARRYTSEACNKLACEAESVQIFAKRNSRVQPIQGMACQRC